MTNDERQRPTHLDLFSGIGGFSLGFEAEGFRTVRFCEIDPEASIVLAAHWPGVKNFQDVRIIDRRILEEIGPVDVITGGVPCQPASALGQMRGTDDERWLWPEAIRVVGEIRPRIALFENPPSLLRLQDGRAWDGIVNGLAALGYDCWWDVIPAAIVGAGHIRERLFLLASDDACEPKRGQTNEAHAVTDRRRTRDESGRDDSQSLAADGGSKRLEGLAGNGDGSEGRAEARRPITPPDLRGRVHSENWWHEDVTGVPVLVYGVPGRLAEATCRVTGNAVVPQVAQIFARTIRRMISRS